MYLDYNATAPVLAEVRAALPDLLTNVFANPSSPHAAGRDARNAMEAARLSVARFVHQPPENILFTSGATESIQTAFHHYLSVDTPDRSAALPVTEHPSSLNAARMFQKSGAQIHLIPVNTQGQVDLCVLESILQSRPDFFSFCAANNETGVLADLETLLKLCCQYDVPCHVDATQWMGKLPWPDPMNLPRQTMISFSAHKLGGIKGCGVLVHTPECRLRPLIPGGGQESGMRGGTPNIPGILALGIAVENLRFSSIAIDRQYENKMSFESVLRSGFSLAQIHGANVRRLPNTTSVSLPGLDAEELVLKLSSMGLAISTGSACSTGALEPSHVLRAMEIPLPWIQSTIRISSGPSTPMEDLHKLVQALEKCADGWPG